MCVLSRVRKRWRLNSRLFTRRSTDEESSTTSRRSCMLPTTAVVLFTMRPIDWRASNTRLVERKQEKWKRRADRCANKLVNDGTPSILLRRKFLDRFYSETGMQELRNRAEPLWGANTLVWIDFQTIFEAAKGKASFAVMMECIHQQLDELNEKLKPVDVMAFIVFSLSSNYYASGSWQKEEAEYLEATFREMVEGGETVTQDDLETAANVLLRVFTAQWN